MSTFADRLRASMSAANMKAVELHELTGISKASISEYLSSNYEPKQRNIFKIAQALDVSPSYLMGVSDTPQNTSAAPPQRPRKKGVRIPVLGSVAAGVPIEAVEDVIDYEEIEEQLARTGDFFALQVRGASMEPVLYEGDVVIVRKQSSVSTGDIAIVLINGDEATVKKIRCETGGVMLIGYNAAVYEPHFYTNEDIERLPVQILGKVVEMRRKF
mgnify:FL=1